MTRDASRPCTLLTYWRRIVNSCATPLLYESTTDHFFESYLHLAWTSDPESCKLHVFSACIKYLVYRDIILRLQRRANYPPSIIKKHTRQSYQTLRDQTLKLWIFYNMCLSFSKIFLKIYLYINLTLIWYGIGKMKIFMTERRMEE